MVLWYVDLLSFVLVTIALHSDSVHVAHFVMWIMIFPHIIGKILRVPLVKVSYMVKYIYMCLSFSRRSRNPLLWNTWNPNSPATGLHRATVLLSMDVFIYHLTKPSLLQLLFSVYCFNGDDQDGKQKKKMFCHRCMQSAGRMRAI